MVKIIHFFIFIISLIKINQLEIKDEKETEIELSDDIVILYTNDVHCGFLTDIGYDGLMLYKKELEKEYKNILLVDGGDHIQGDAIGILSKGLDIIEIMNKIGYNVRIIGNHEFDYEIDALIKCNNTLNNGGYISANFCYRKNKTSIFNPYRIIEIGGKRLGFISVITPETLTKTYLSKLKDEKGEMIYDFLSGNDDNELYDTIQNYIDDLRNNSGVDFIIIISHIGNEGNSEKYSTDKLISHLKNVDAVLDGHTHKVYNTSSIDKDNKNVTIIQTGTKLSYIGVLKIKNDSIISELISEVPEPNDQTGSKKIKRNNKDRWVDSEMNDFINKIIDKHSGELNRVIGYSDFDLIINVDKSDNNNQLSRSEESPLCDLVADSIRNIGDGKITLISSGSIRADMKKGNITYKNILEILPYNNEIIVKEILGQDILDALEYGVRLLPEKSPKFLQVSGISFTVNIYKESTVEVDENEMFVKVAGSRRVSNVRIGKKRLDAKKKYILSFDNYIGNGGDGYSMFSKYEEIYSTLTTDNNALCVYIEKDLNGTIPDTYRDKQGRITIISEKENNTLIVALIILFVILVVLFIIIIILVAVKKKYFHINSNEIDNIEEKNIVQNQ